MHKNKLVLSNSESLILSKTQAKFNKLVVEIENLKKEKVEFLNQIKLAESKYHKQILPLLFESKDEMIKLLLEIDQAYETLKLVKKEREAISRFIADNIDELMEMGEKAGLDEDLKTLKDLYLKHEGISYDEQKQGENDLTADVFESMFGFRVNPDEFDNEEYMEEMQQQFESNFNFEAPKERKKSKKQLEKEAKEKEAADKMKKDARSIYTQLAKLLHPDTEQDETIREQKTELMKRVTNAYSANDLYELLQIQIEVEQLDSESLIKTSDELMESYIKVLQKQANELRYEINYEIGQNPIAIQYFTYTNKFSESKFKKTIKDIREGINDCRKMMVSCKTQVEFKEFAKQLVKEFKEEEDYDFFW